MREDLRGLLASAVGLESIHALLDEVRGTMVQEALRRSRGNIAHAAKLLGITRQGVQQIIRRHGGFPRLSDDRTSRRPQL
jgi:transcriptional regulator of acetoin/glycerol metabolism